MKSDRFNAAKHSTLFQLINERITPRKKTKTFLVCLSKSLLFSELIGIREQIFGNRIKPLSNKKKNKVTQRGRDSETEVEIAYF